MPLQSGSPAADNDPHVVVIYGASVEFSSRFQRYAVCFMRDVNRPHDKAARPPGLAEKWLLTRSHTPNRAAVTSLLQEVDAYKLRALLKHDEEQVWRLGDHAIRQVISRRIEHGDIALVQSAIKPPAFALCIAHAAAQPESGSSSTPKAGHVSSSAQSSATELSPTAKPAPASNVAHLEHDRQALALVLAALHGLPFCEECARSGQEYAAA